VVERESLPAELEITAWTDDGIIMGLQHRRYRVFGVQFHPESIATEFGHDLLRNFLAMK
jgi:anthranilate/para-aminobenzoate synthase component II